MSLSASVCVNVCVCVCVQVQAAMNAMEDEADVEAMEGAEQEEEEDMKEFDETVCVYDSSCSTSIYVYKYVRMLSIIICTYVVYVCIVSTHTCTHICSGVNFPAVMAKKSRCLRCRAFLRMFSSMVFSDTRR